MPEESFERAPQGHAGKLDLGQSTTENRVRDLSHLP